MQNPPARNRPIPLDDRGFDQVVAAAGRPVLVDFWAPWCPPCRAIAPELERLAAEHGDRVLVAKVDIDSNPELVERFSIRSIPTLVLLREGQERDRIVGTVSASDVLTRLDQLA